MGWLAVNLPLCFMTFAANVFVLGLMARTQIVLAARPMLSWAATGIFAMYGVVPLFLAPYVCTRTPSMSHPKITMWNFWLYAVGAFGFYMPKPERVSEEASDREPEPLPPSKST